MNLIKLSAIDSTNDYLKSMASSIISNDETVVWAEEQLKGRGQRGAKWYSEKGKSLTFSVLKGVISLPPADSFHLSMAVSLAVAKSLTSFEVPEVSVKWPNDIMSAEKKIAGILIENQLRNGVISQAIIGIGINVNAFSSFSPENATTMESVTGIEYDLRTILEIIVEEISKSFGGNELLYSETIQHEYHQNLFRRDIASSFSDENGESFQGIIRGVNDAGQLLVETDHKGISAFDLKTIKYNI